jgi:hypothetical protein
MRKELPVLNREGFDLYRSGGNGSRLSSWSQFKTAGEGAFEHEQTNNLFI